MIMAFYPTTLGELGEDVCQMFKDGFLLTAEYEGRVNTMTIGWGMIGVMWGKDIVVTAVRPERYTDQLMKKSETFSIALMPPEHKKVLSYCGRVSGRDEDKIETNRLTVCYDSQTPYLAESRVVILCRKLAELPMTEQNFLGKCEIPTRWYGAKNGGYHTLYFGEIVKVLQSETDLPKDHRK